MYAALASDRDAKVGMRGCVECRFYRMIICGIITSIWIIINCSRNGGNIRKFTMIFGLIPHRRNISCTSLKNIHNLSKNTSMASIFHSASSRRTWSAFPRWDVFTWQTITNLNVLLCWVFFTNKCYQLSSLLVSLSNSSSAFCFSILNHYQTPVPFLR